MKKLLPTTFLIVVILLVGGSFSPTSAQTEEEFRLEFQLYFETHDRSEWAAYVFGRLAGMTTNAILEEYVWSSLERSFITSPCLGVKQQICDSEFEQKLLEATVFLTAAGTACLLASAAGPFAVAVCMAAVASQHALRLSAAKKAHRACYLKARLDCLPLPPGPCTNAATNGTDGKDSASDGDPSPSIIECDWSDTCDCQERSPILVDIAGDGFDLTDLEHGVRFNITGSLGPEPLSWTRPNSDDAFLVLDLNANGTIDDGGELLGNFSAQPAPVDGEERNGFRALALFDTNEDGIIDNKDGVYSELRLWQDKNHNAISEPGELQSLERVGLTSLELKHLRSKKVDEYGNEFRYRAKVHDGRSAQLGRWAWDVFLVSALRRRPSGESFQWQEK